MEVETKSKDYDPNHKKAHGSYKWEVPRFMFMHCAIEYERIKLVYHNVPAITNNDRYDQNH
jgi:hypothetical protein